MSKAGRARPASTRLVGSGAVLVGGPLPEPVLFGTTVTLARIEPELPGAPARSS